MRLGCGNGSRGELGAVGLTQNWAGVGGWEVGVKQACLVKNELRPPKKASSPVPAGVWGLVLGSLVSP